jgi:hypothetical protein
LRYAATKDDALLQVHVVDASQSESVQPETPHHYP